VSGTRRVLPPAQQPETAARAVLLLGTDPDWPPELVAGLEADGWTVSTVADVSAVPSLVAGQAVDALFLFARPLGASDVLALRRVRESSARTAVVVVTRTPTDSDLKRAFEHGATAFLSWPASAAALRQAIESGGAHTPPGSRRR
jgi:DNA-binding response OmpR family regulator